MNTIKMQEVTVYKQDFIGVYFVGIIILHIFN